jgi:hypothetical protein
MTIFKYQLELTDAQMVALPKGAIVRHVARQGEGRGERLCLWCEVDPDAPAEWRTFAVRGTGHPFDVRPGDAYLGTVHLDSGRLVFHVYECVASPAAAPEGA